MYYKYIVSSTIGLFFGIAISFLLNFSTEIFFVSLFLFVVNFLIYKFSKKSFGVYKSLLSKIFSIFFISLSLSILFGQFVISHTLEKNSEFLDYVNSKSSFTGIVSDISISQSSQNFILNIEENKDYRIKVITSLYPKYKAGDYVEIEGKISSQDIILPNVVDYAKSLDISNINQLHKIDGLIAFPKININKEKYSDSIFFKLENLKNTFVTILQQNSEIQSAALAAGTTLGDASLFSNEELKNFRISGLSHIIVLSGFNITILIFISMYLFSILKIRLKFRILLSIIFIIFFIIFVGATPSIVRAAVMGGVSLFASFYGSRYIAKQALFLSVFFMILINPYIAIYDISFHLSFLATFAILYLLPIFDNYNFFKKREEKILKIKNTFLKNLLKDLFEIFKVTLAVQVFVTPYIIFTFGKVSLFGLIANILVIPIVPIIMLLTIFIILFSFVFSPLAHLFGYIAVLFSRYIFLIVESFSTSGFNQYESRISFFNMIIFYIILILIILFEEKRIIIKKYLNN